MERTKSGTWGWVGLGVYVAAWDLLAPETLTHAYKRYDTAVRVGGIAITGAHLLGLLPKQVDPFYLALELPGIRRADVDKGPTI